ncbi:MAG: PH domain-containing protein [Patescibacteria group bacterium]|jgi:hypothetical protein|nr:PH domain-containing protein [Patescibacteria group bacterium]
MFKPNHILRENENILKSAHPHPLTFTWSILIAILLLLGGFFFMYPLFQKGTWGIALFVAMIMIGFILILRIYVSWFFSELIITNFRVINLMQQGLFHRQVVEVDYDKISDVDYQVKGIFRTLFQYGDINVQILPNKKITIQNIAKPKIDQNLISQICQEQRQARQAIEKKLLTAEDILNNTPLQEIYKVIRSLKISLGKDNLEKIINQTDQNDEEI